MELEGCSFGRGIRKVWVDTDYFGDTGKVWMINFRVRDLDAMMAQLAAAGIPVKVDPESCPNGRSPDCTTRRAIRSSCGSRLRSRDHRERL
jgi:hypothetical protein